MMLERFGEFYRTALDAQEEGRFRELSAESGIPVAELWLFSPNAAENPLNYPRWFTAEDRRRYPRWPLVHRSEVAEGLWTQFRCLSAPPEPEFAPLDEWRPDPRDAPPLLHLDESQQKIWAVLMRGCKDPELCCAFLRMSRAEFEHRVTEDGFGRVGDRGEITLNYFPQ
jgi:hypothetical protein